MRAGRGFAHGAGRYGPGKCCRRLECDAKRSASPLSGLWLALAAARNRHVHVPNARQLGAAAGTPLWHVSGLWRRAFSPSMTNLRSCQAISRRGSRKASSG